MSLMPNYSTSTRELNTEEGVWGAVRYKQYRETSSLLMLISEIMWLFFRFIHPKGSVLMWPTIQVRSEISPQISKEQ